MPVMYRRAISEKWSWMGGAEAYFTNSKVDVPSNIRGQAFGYGITGGIQYHITKDLFAIARGLYTFSDFLPYRQMRYHAVSVGVGLNVF